MQKVADVPAGLREAKKLATRKALVSAARRLGLANGLDAVTVEMISAEVGVSVRTFFNYFESKEAAIVGNVADVGTPAAQQLFRDGGPTGDLLSDLVVLLDPSAAIEAEGRNELAMAFALVQSEPKVLALQLARGIEHEQKLAELVAARRGLPAADGDCVTAAAVAQTLLRRGALDWFRVEDDRTVTDHMMAAAAAVRSLVMPDNKSQYDTELSEGTHR